MEWRDSPAGYIPMDPNVSVNWIPENNALMEEGYNFRDLEQSTMKAQAMEMLLGNEATEKLHRVLKQDQAES